MFSGGSEKTLLEFGSSFVDVLTAKVRAEFPVDSPVSVDSEL